MKFVRAFVRAMVKSCFLLVLLGHVGMANAQTGDNFIRRTARQLFSPKGDSTRKADLIALPTAAYAQETGLEYGAIGTYNFYVDRENRSIRTSNMTLQATLTTKKQKNIKLLTDIWTKNNAYHILSEFRYRDWPFNFYGLGNDTRQADEDRLEQKMTRAKVEVEKQFASRFYAGLNANFEFFSFSDVEPDGIFETSPLSGRTGGRHLALGVSVLYDSRNVTTYSTKGFYARFKYAYAPNFWGGGNFSGSQWEANVRGFHSPAQMLTLAGQLVYRGTDGGADTPFYVHHNLGGDMAMRGYYLGRYRDKNYAAAQAEIRCRFLSRLGAVGFAGTGSTFSSQNAPRFVPSYGLGMRYFFSLEHHSTIRFDYAVGEQRPGEKRQSGFYLSIAEAF